MSKIVILGADGFIGRHLAIKLAQNSSDTIIAFDRFSAYQNGEEHPFNPFNNITMVAGNFFNRIDLAEVLTETDFLFHLISSTNPAASNSDPFIDIDTNVRSSIELFELCVEKKVGKVIFLSSGGTVYGDVDDEAINELAAPAPRSPYGIGKLTIEHYLRYFKFTHDLNYIIYRVANPYGPGQNILGKQGVVPIFMNKFITKQPITIYGEGTMTRDFIFIDDLIEMIAVSYAKSARFNEYNIGSGNGKTVKEIVEAIETCAGYTVQKEHVPTPATYIEKSVLDISRFVSEYSIKPSTTLEDGIKKTWNYVEKLK